MRTGAAGLLTGWVLSMAAGAAAFATDPAIDARKPSAVGTERVFALGEVVVEADRVLPETPATINEITATEIARQAPRDLGEAMQAVPGVQYRLGRSKNEYYVTVRGFEQEDVLILLDGVPLYVPYEGLINLSDIPVQNIAKIKVIKGSSSVLYGQNGMGGTINVVTRRGGAKPTVGVSYEGGDFKTHHLAVTHGWTVGPLTYFLGGSHRVSDGTSLADAFSLPQAILDSMRTAPTKPTGLRIDVPAADRGRRDNSDYRRDSVTFTGSLGLAPGHVLGLSLAYYNNEYGVPPVPIYKETKKGFYWYPRYWRFAAWNRTTVNLIEESNLSSSLRIKLRGFHDAYDNTLDAYDTSTCEGMIRETPPSGRSVYDDYSDGGNLYSFWTGLVGNELRGSVGLKRDVHRENFQGGAQDRLASDTWSIGLEDEYQFTPLLRATVGVGYDIFQQKERRQVITPDSVVSVVGKDLSTVSPQAGVHYAPSAGVDLYAGLARKVRFPTMRKLYSTGVVGPQGDPNLKETATINYELGGRFRLAAGLNGSTAIYYSNVSHLVNFDNIIGRFEQYDKARMAGVELGLEAKILPDVPASINYTFLDASTDSPVTIKTDTHGTLTYTPDRLPYRAAHTVDLEVGWTPRFGLDLGVTGSWRSKEYFYDHADAANGKKLVAVKRSLDSRCLLGLRLAQAITPHAKASLGVENLLNADYRDIDMFPGRGVTWRGGVSVSLDPG